MAEIGAYDAKTHLPELLERVARGERITITKHGVPVARLVPIERAGARPVAEAIAALKATRRGQRLRGLSVRAMIEEGRR